jgi:hypothetical protein
MIVAEVPATALIESAKDALPIDSVAPADCAIVVPVVPFVELTIVMPVAGSVQVIAAPATNAPVLSTAMTVGVALPRAPATVAQGIDQSVQALPSLPVVTPPVPETK